MLEQGTHRSGEGDWLAQASALLRENLTEPADYATLSAAFGMSYETFLQDLQPSHRLGLVRK